ncbi:MAG TPA: tRNA-uridine aminocarboxypropyltransferase [Kofleriaceae bacterium]
MQTETFTPRTVCQRCRRPTTVCYCSALPTLETRTKIVILQHPREREMPIGTARMASLCLPRAQLHVGVRWDNHAELAAALGDPTHPPILLYPGAGAKNILAEPPVGPVTLVVVDGTWSQAKTVVRDNPVLHALPRYAFDSPEPSNYRIRKEPKVEYVSTIEALMHVLGALENDAPRFRALLDPLNAMVDAQLAAQAGNGRRPGVKRQPKVVPPPRLPLPELLTHWDNLVVVVGEANAWPFSNDRGDSPRDELAHWLAYRVSTGETFSMIARPERELSPTAVFHTKLTEAQLRAGAPRAEVVEAYAHFARPDDIVVSWGHYGPQLFLDAGGTLPRGIDLRTAAQRFESKKLGPLEHYATSLGKVPLTLAEGRGGERLAQLAHILSSWRALSLARLGRSSA